LLIFDIFDGVENFWIQVNSFAYFKTRPYYRRRGEVSRYKWKNVNKENFS